MNLPEQQKNDWNENDTVRPVHMNSIGDSINQLALNLPIYAANGSFYENTDYTSSTYNLVPVHFTDDSQNVAPTSYFNGMEVVFKSSTSNTGDCYVDVNGLGAKQIKTLKNVALTAGSIPEGWLVTLRFDSVQDCFYILENKGAVGRNVGDFFYTWRKDDTLNGAFDCKGAEYNYNDFTGDTNPYDLLVAGSLPHVSYEEYEAQLQLNNGVCGYFGLDTVNRKFKVPTMNDVFVEAGDLANLGKYLEAGLPNITGLATAITATSSFTSSGSLKYTRSLNFSYSGYSSSGDARVGELAVNATDSSDLYKDDFNTVQPPSIKLRPMVQLSTGASEESLANTTQCLAELPKKANIIWYANREFEYKQPNFILADKQYVTIKGGTAIRLANGDTFYTENDMLKPISEILDTGSVSNGKDYYFYLDNQSNLIASLNEVLPAGITNAVQIGGAHTLCVSVTSANAPTLLSDSFWTDHPAAGYNAGYFIPNSSWTPAFRSAAKTGNKGQALVDYYSIKKWVDIYLQSGTGTATASSYDGTITNSRQPILHHQDMMLVGKELPNDMEFSVFAEGSNQKTSIAGAAIPSDKKCGGYLDTAGKRMISGFFIECCCGYLWQWSSEIAPTGSSNWNQYGDTRRGASYGMPYVLALGGRYGDSSNCGSLSRISDTNRVYVSAADGARGVSLHLERQHA